MAAKTSTTLLRLRSFEGKVLVAPAWDHRPSAAAALPLETGVPLRALEKAVLFWVRRALAEAIGGAGESGSDDGDWEANFLRCLQQDGLAAETVAAAVEKLRGIDALAGVVPDFTLAAAAGHRPSSSSSSAAETTASCHSHSHSHADASPDRAATSRARGRQRREEEEEAADQDSPSLADHRKTRQAAAATAASDDDVRSSATSAPPAAVTGPSLRVRRGLPELHTLQVNNLDTLLALELLLA